MGGLGGRCLRGLFAEVRVREGRRGAVERREVVSATEDAGTEKTEVVGDRGKGAERWV
ncbi:hypothetical protein AGABI2DRAFT_196194 [Agaricus bisporus var. bisporus H97]|uniref:hypothetical protein n=1 Tax=Agaricus bisporus var. bisporus (strain H97 / ATCC MYA-4626 / FGSC 10389) TaxID=936046 RepID=UPI00029F58A7|nr:hypothetical protein AGABI2DRAFT_196194 [Agaricus bisporus var. bisporus H97]EKV41930.1 hypothetical protein AGABI2DRAFT_196194 [Agaricus bisporus var. bisporus H97]